MPPPASSIAKKHDYIIIGAGSSGCALAWRLATKCPGAKIALIEEGPQQLVPRSQSSKNASFTRIPITSVIRESAAFKGWNMSRRARLYKTNVDLQPLNHPRVRSREMTLLRGCGVGGTEFFTDGQYLRGWPADFKDWNTVGEGWNWEDVCPAYQSLENTKTFLPNGEDNDDRPGTDGPLKVAEITNYLARMELNQAFAEACRVSGMPLLGPTGTFPTGNSGVAMNMFMKDERGLRVFASDILYKDRDDYSNSQMIDGIDLMSGKRVVKLDIPSDENSASKKLTRVVLSNGETLEAGKEVIVCAGPIETAALLQRSGVGDEKMLFDNGMRNTIVSLPVGLTLVDRPEFSIAYNCRDGLLETRSVSNANIGYLREQYRDYKVDGLGVHSATSELTAFMEASFAPPERPAYMGRFYMFPWDYRVNRPRTFMDGYCLATQLLHPCSRGYINGIATEGMKNGEEDPQIELNYLQQRDDRAYLQDGIMWAQHMTSPTPAIGVHSMYSIGQNYHQNSPFLKFKTDLYSPKFDLQTAGQDLLWAAEAARSSGMHLYGSCPMGTVVDEKMRVKGLDGVRLCGASVIPNTVSGSIATISMMTGVRCADFLAAAEK